MNRPSPQFKPMSLDDFEELLADAPDDERWELINGRVVRMMVGARWEHNRIINNLAAGLDSRFRASGSSCRTLTETFRLKNEATGASLLPDLLIFCGRPPDGATFLSDATVLIEVMSDGTQRRDREEKWASYQRLPSLKHYALVTRDAPHVEIFDRHGDTWSGLRIADGLEARFELPALDISIPLIEVYADLFEAGPPTAAG